MQIKINEHCANSWKNELKELPEFNECLTSSIIEQSASLARKYLNLRDIHLNELRMGGGLIEFSNLPIDDQLCPPPTSASRPYTKGYISELVLLGVTNACGLNPFAFKAEKQGALVHEITPIYLADNKSISSEGVAEFDFHTDGAYLSRNIRPHTLSLMCLVDEKKTSTNLVKLSDVVNKLSQKSKEVLVEPRFVHTAPETFKVKNRRILSSIFDLVDGHYEIKAALHNVNATDEDSECALFELKTAVSECQVQKSWDAGDLIIFNNLRCLHGRGEIIGTRWLQRCYGTYTFSPATVLDIE
ncbi:TauD/TfdA family dioxygenase [Acinetobacter zhairhuonensis]|uniref:TauD/TfdA family dioxygenase n=1 Tax=Acinetobacter sp. A7.4 TaxID=2919921 RepID=UPI001F4FC1E9|nr:TauD/TfdA family dioxygenase [Acinetobacter sp. A7.4]MCJ8162949.1 TauD/TfdA family dioxygenase [Acinetobacter sp. A7.4]